MLSNRRIGILNFQYSNHNYGAVLQAAALEFSLRSLGCDAVHIDYRPKRPITLRYTIGAALRFLRLRRSKKGYSMRNNDVFEAFRNEYITRTRLVSTEKGFRAVAKDFDVVVVGSDQVWRPSMSANPSAFFLAYVPEDVDRVSYAASFGIDEWELASSADLTRKIKAEILKFKAISCREDQGVSICRSEFNVDATHVLDPLLLVSDDFLHDLVKNEVNDRDPVVYYKLDADDEFNSALLKIGMRHDCTPRNIYTRKHAGAYEYNEVISWVSSLHGSKVVVTDSYHCICLALRFGKEVVYSPNPGRGQSRLDSLFKMFNIRLIPVEDVNGYGAYRLISDSSFYEVLREKQKFSFDYILRALAP